GCAPHPIPFPHAGRPARRTTRGSPGRWRRSNTSPTSGERTRRRRTTPGATDRIDERTPTFAIRVGDQPPEKTAIDLAGRGIHVWDGHYYAITIMERL